MKYGIFPGPTLWGSCLPFLAVQELATWLFGLQALNIRGCQNNIRLKIYNIKRYWHSFSIWDGKYPQQTSPNNVAVHVVVLKQGSYLKISTLHLWWAAPPVGGWWLSLFSANTSDRIQGNVWDHLPLTAEQLTIGLPFFTTKSPFLLTISFPEKKCNVTLGVLNPCHQRMYPKEW